MTKSVLFEINGDNGIQLKLKRDVLFILTLQNNDNNNITKTVIAQTNFGEFVKKKTNR